MPVCCSFSRYIASEVELGRLLLFTWRVAGEPARIQTSKARYYPMQPASSSHVSKEADHGDQGTTRGREREEARKETRKARERAGREGDTAQWR